MAKYTKRKQRVRRSNLKKTVRGSQRLNRAVNNMKTTKKRRVRRVSRKGRKKSRQSGGTELTVTEVLRLIKDGIPEDTQVTVTGIDTTQYEFLGKTPLVEDGSFKLDLKKIIYLKPPDNDIPAIDSTKAKSEINNEFCAIIGETPDRTKNYNLGLLRKRERDIYLTVLLVLTGISSTTQSKKNTLSTGSIKHFYRHIPLEGTISKLQQSSIAANVIARIEEAEAEEAAKEAKEGEDPKCDQPATGAPIPPPRLVYGIDDSGNTYETPITDIYAQVGE